MSKLAKALTAAAGNAGGDNLYVEDVFSTYLYDGSSSAQTITNGIDLDGEGGMVWIKERNTSGSENHVSDTERGIKNPIQTNSTDAENSYYFDNNLGITSFNNNGFTVASGSNFNDAGDTTVSWTFRKAEKFFDVVTYSGNNTLGRTVAHNLGSAPAFIIVKCTSNSTTKWTIYHSSLGATKYLEFDTGAAGTAVGFWNNTEPTDSVFTLGNDGAVNATGRDYVAYLFASDAGGFGDDGSESIIKCGSYGPGTETLDGPEVNLGWEPQWILTKAYDNGGDWVLHDNMRGVATNGDDKWLRPNTSGAELTSENIIFTSTGFKITSASAYVNQSGYNYIYIAIRRPMKTPESGTEVFALENGNGGGSSTVPEFSAPFASDLFYMQNRYGGGANHNGSRLAGNSYLLFENSAAEASGLFRWDSMNGMYFFSTTDYIGYMFKRATGFFDVVAYTGTGVARNVAHNLGVVPELLIFKTRSAAVGWAVSCGEVGYTNGSRLEQSSQFYSEPNRVTGTPTSTTVPIGTDAYVNVNGRTYIAYLFATLAGVSKVGSYTGTGSNVDVDCGFSAGARFILIKRTDSTGDWYVWDSVRGIVAGNDPYLLLNSTAAEVTSTDYIDPLASGFTVTSSAPAALNASGGTYIFLAIA